MILHQHPVCQNQFISTASACDSNSSSGASSQHPSPITTPQKLDATVFMNCTLPLNLSANLQDSGISCNGSVDGSPTHSSFIPRQSNGWVPVTSEQEQQLLLSQQQQALYSQQYMHPSGYPLLTPVYPSSAYANPGLIQYLPTTQSAYQPVYSSAQLSWQQQVAAAQASYLYSSPQVYPVPSTVPAELAAASTDRLPATAGYQLLNFGTHVPSFDLIKWYSEKPPFILDGTTTSLYKMREIDRRVPSVHHLTMDMEYNTIIAEYFVLRNVFGPEYAVEKNVFIKLNRTKDGELARFIHLFFKEADDADMYLKHAERLGSQPVQRTNPRAFSKHNVYITTMPFHLLNKDQLCNFICCNAIQRRVNSTQDIIKRARVDVEKQSALVEFHRPEDASATCRYFYDHVKQANARPAFEKVSDNNASQQNSDEKPAESCQA